MKYQVNQLVPNSKYLMNSLSIEIPFEYAEKRIRMNWHDIIFAIVNGYFCCEAAVEHAKAILGHDHKHEGELISLLCLEPNEVMYGDLFLQKITRLADDVSEEEKEQTNEKVLFLVLLWLYDNIEDFDYPFLAIEVIYTDFDYPESIKGFIGYAQPKDPARVGKNVMFEEWQAYLSEQSQRFAPMMPSEGSQNQ